MKTRKLTKKDFTKEGVFELIKRDIKDINSLSDEDLISIVSFFKYLSTDTEPMKFATNKFGIISKFKEVINRKLKEGYEIVDLEELIGG